MVKTDPVQPVGRFGDVTERGWQAFEVLPELFGKHPAAATMKGTARWRMEVKLVVKDVLASELIAHVSAVLASHQSLHSSVAGSRSISLARTIVAVVGGRVVITPSS